MILSDTLKIVRNEIKRTKPVRLIEMGSGKFSTNLIRKWLSEYSPDGHLVSLESDPAWYKKKPANDKYGEVIFSKLLHYPLVYDYNLEGIYDLVLIDGPSMPEDNKRQNIILSECKKFEINRTKGSQSMHMLEYVWDYVDEKSIILVDGRFATVEYYRNKFKNKITIEGLGRELKHRCHTCSMIRKQENI